MNDSRFLKALKRRGKLKLVQPSEDICSSYLHKSDNCLAAARILLDAGLCENSIAEAYYGMYLCVMALFFRCGIKCESHTGAVILLKRAFGLVEQSRTLLRAKGERIDRQYYVTDRPTDVTRALAGETIREAEIFTLEARAAISSFGAKSVSAARRAVEGV